MTFFAPLICALKQRLCRIFEEIIYYENNVHIIISHDSIREKLYMKYFLLSKIFEGKIKFLLKVSKEKKNLGYRKCTSRRLGSYRNPASFCRISSCGVT